MGKELKPYLPTAKELEDMDLHQFERWVDEACMELQKRVVLRDPLYHLRKRISQRLSVTYGPEAEKERDVQRLIGRYYRTIR